MKTACIRILFLFFIPAWGYSQSSHPICGNDLFSAMLRKHYPALQDNVDATFESALHAGTPRNNEPMIVHVIVHVVWKEAAENLDESIILDQIRVLNEDFNRRNADTVNLRPVFQPEAGSPGIQFELADIIRVQTDVDFAVDILGTNLLPEVKHDALGGSDALDTEQYLNIWVCKIQPIEIFGIVVGQILGFAFPPNNLLNWPENSGAPAPDEDGVVIDYRVFGSNNPNPIENPDGSGNIIVKGRTPVHEVGHYFGLRHIWGDGGLLGPNDCAQSDGIDDTPYANAESAFDCDTTKNTCAQIEAHYGMDMPDLIENYMDYASEDCMNMFTRNQSTLMQNILLGPRSGLLTPFSGVSNLRDQIALRIVPNPSEGHFTVKLETINNTQGLVRILDAHGRVIMTRDRLTLFPGTHTLSFDERPLAPGMYFVEIRTTQGAMAEKMIVY
ncbi:MAG: T9SS type A sorting domain-containing protein [Saprospiraceae bacterium]|nr:T9SS type A sorting domain-containing protein [Candidatus Opimibacter iunctus]